jgi:hypothetical protein
MTGYCEDKKNMRILIIVGGYLSILHKRKSWFAANVVAQEGLWTWQALSAGYLKQNL